MNHPQLWDETVKKYIEMLILPSDPAFPLWNRENFIFRKKTKWNYIDGCMISALIRLYELLGDKRLLDYAVRFTDCYVNESGDIPSMNLLDYNLDNVNGGRNLLWLYKKNDRKKYLLAAEKIINQLENQPRLQCGNFWHKAVYPNQIWLDGTYMAFPFMAEYAASQDKPELISDIISQLENIRRLMKDEKTGLYFHGFDETRSSVWADSSSGLSKNLWLRSMGWLCAALADLCEILPECDVFRDMLAKLLTSLSVYANEDGMLFQLPALRTLKGNYPETSGTLLFAYSAIKAYRLNIVGENIKSAGIKAFSAVMEKYISKDENGLPILENICLTAGLGMGRDGSAEYYLSEKITQNDAKGIAPLLMAYTQIKELNQI